MVSKFCCESNHSSERDLLEGFLPDIPNGLIEPLLEDLRRGNFATVISRSNDLLKTYPNSILVLNIKGVALLNSNEYDLAERCFRMGIKKTPAIDYTWLNLGNLYFKRVRYGELWQFDGNKTIEATLQVSGPTQIRYRMVRL